MRLSLLEGSQSNLEILECELLDLPDGIRGWVDTHDDVLYTYYVNDSTRLFMHDHASIAEKLINSGKIGIAPSDKKAYLELLARGWAAIYKYPTELDIRVKREETLRIILRALHRKDRLLTSKTIYCSINGKTSSIQSQENLKKYLY